MELTDGRVTLRTPTAADAATVAESVRISVDTLRPWMPWASIDYDESDAMDWIERRLDDTEVPLLILDEARRIVGASGLNKFDRLNGRANLGYWLRSDAGGHGYATAAAALTVGYGLGEAGLHRIEILMSVENTESQRVAERLGASYEGVLRQRLWCTDERHHDTHSYAVIAGDPTAARLVAGSRPA